MNAEDVIFSLKRMMGEVDDLPALNRENQARGEFHQAQERAYQQKANRVHYPYFESIALKKKIANISALDNYTVKLELTEPDNALLSHLASQYAVILSKEYALQLNADENLHQLDLYPVGTGVYQLASYSQNNYIRLQPHPDYWGKKAQIKNMVIDFSSDGTGRMAKFLTGECDVVAFPEPSQLFQIDPKQIVRSEGANLAFLAFNTRRPVMQNLNLRQGIAASVDIPRMIDHLFFGYANVAENVLPQVLWKSKEKHAKVAEQAVDFEQKNAKFALKAPLNFWVVDDKRVFNLHPMKMAEMIRYDLAKVGISVKIKPVSRAYVAQRYAEGNADYDMILTGWLANNADLNGFLNPILSCRSQNELTNLANWCSQEFDFWLDVAKLSDGQKTRDMMYQLTQIEAETHLPILPLVNAKRLLLVNDRLENVAISPFGEVKLSAIKRRSLNIYQGDK